MDTDIYNIMLVTSYGQEMLMFNFNSTKEDFSIYILNCMRGKQGWIPFAKALREHQMKKNINYNRFTNNLFGWPFFSKVTGFYS